MVDSRIVGLARVMTDYSVGIRPGDKVAIMGTSAGAPLVREVYRQVLQRGGHPILLVDLPGIEPILFNTASEEQLRFVSPVKKLVYETFDVRIRIGSESNTRELTHVDPARQAIYAEATGTLLETVLDRSARMALTVYSSGVLIFCIEPPCERKRSESVMVLSTFQIWPLGLLVSQVFMHASTSLASGLRSGRV